jgi:hypothetical protein
MMVSMCAVRQLGLQRRDQQNALAGKEFAKFDVGVPVLVEGAQKARWAEFVFANEPSRPGGDFRAVVTPPNATPPQ